MLLQDVFKGSGETGEPYKPVKIGSRQTCRNTPFVVFFKVTILSVNFYGKHGNLAKGGLKMVL